MTLKVMEADSILERSMTIHQGIDKMLALYSVIREEEASIFQTTLDKILQFSMFFMF